MTSSDFLLVTTPEWIVAENPNDMIFSYGEEGLAAAITREEWGFLQEVVRAGGYLPEGKTLVEMRMLSIGTSESRLHLWLRFDPIAPVAPAV